MTLKLRDNALEAEATIASLWSRMTDLYGDKWLHREGPLNTSEGELSAGALRWIKELGSMEPEEISEGFRILEGEIKTNKLKGIENWPPSSVEYIALCESARKKMYQTSRSLGSCEGKPLDKEQGSKLFQGLLSELS